MRETALQGEDSTYCCYTAIRGKFLYLGGSFPTIGGKVSTVNYRCKSAFWEAKEQYFLFQTVFPSMKVAALVLRRRLGYTE